MFIYLKYIKKLSSARLFSEKFRPGGLTFVRRDGNLLQCDMACHVAPPSLGVSSLDSGRLARERPFFLRGFPAAADAASCRLT